MVRFTNFMLRPYANEPFFPALRLVDNKAILYFDAPSASAALNWYRGASCFRFLCLSY